MVQDNATRVQEVFKRQTSTDHQSLTKGKFDSSFIKVLMPQGPERLANLDREQLTASLHDYPLDPRKHLARAQCYLVLKYADLAAGDAYRALELVENGLDEDYSDYLPEIWDEERQESIQYTGETYESDLVDQKFECLLLIAESCSQLGCLQDGLQYLLRAETLASTVSRKNQCKNLRENILQKTGASKTNGSQTGDDITTTRKALSNNGAAPREIYPWNDFEPDRSQAEVLLVLNQQLSRVAPFLEARTTALPVLHATRDENSWEDEKNGNTDEMSIQLGLFAKQNLKPGKRILHEPSLLTACRTLHSSLCDCCQSPLPDLSSAKRPIPCPHCMDTVFCSYQCAHLAERKYHGAVCENELGLEEIGREINSDSPSEDLYLLLLCRVIAMSVTQNAHPLELEEVKFLWGDFSTPSTKTELPFSMKYNVELPHRILDVLGISPFSPKALNQYDTWIIETLYAKFRGVASAKQSTWDGKPEVAAVHPLWCLANHSCDPNIKWEWPAPAQHSAVLGEGTEADEDSIGSGIVMAVRNGEERPLWGQNLGTENNTQRSGGINAGEEILNHYCDIRLSVRERREWASGALGGACMCPRCQWEELQDPK